MGLAGFVPGITTGYGSMQFAGPHSEAMLMGVFQLYGLLVGQESPASFVPLNTADDWLHFVLGVSMVALSFVRGDPATRSTTGPAH